LPPLEADPRPCDRERRRCLLRFIRAKTLHDGVTFEMFLERVGNHARRQYALRSIALCAAVPGLPRQHRYYKDRIKMFHVKDAEFNPTGRQGVYGGYQGWVERAGRFRPSATAGRFRGRILLRR